MGIIRLADLAAACEILLGAPQDSVVVTATYRQARQLATMLLPSGGHSFKESSGRITLQCGPHTLTFLAAGNGEKIRGFSQPIFLVEELMPPEVLKEIIDAYPL